MKRILLFAMAAMCAAAAAGGTKPVVKKKVFVACATGRKVEYIYNTPVTLKVALKTPWQDMTDAILSGRLADLEKALAAGQADLAEAGAKKKKSIDTPYGILIEAHDQYNPWFEVGPGDIVFGERSSFAGGTGEKLYTAEYPAAYNFTGKGVAYIYGTPLMVAARARNKFMIRELLKRGANPNVFIRAARVMRRKPAAGNRYDSWNPGKEMYMPGGMFANPVKKDPAGIEMRPFVFALKEVYATDWARGETLDVKKADECAKMLVEAGAVFPGDDDIGRNALWDAVEARSVYLLGLLADAGLDLDKEDNQGKTLLDFCDEQMACATENEKPLVRKCINFIKSRRAGRQEEENGAAADAIETEFEVDEDEADFVPLKPKAPAKE